MPAILPYLLNTGFIYRIPEGRKAAYSSGNQYGEWFLIPQTNCSPTAAFHIPIDFQRFVKQMGYTLYI
jgi:hypothetical protein